MTVEALATFLNDIGVALIRLAEGLDDRPRATVTPIAPDSPAAVPAGVESVGAPPPSAQRGNAGRTCDADGATGPGTTPPVPGPVDRPSPPLDHQCPECGLAFSSAPRLDHHRSERHGVAGASRRKGPSPTNSRRRPTPCGKGCGRVFDWSPAAASHARHCTGEDYLDQQGVADSEEAEDLNTLAVVTEAQEADEVAAGWADEDDDPSPEVEKPAPPTSEVLDPLDPGRVRYRCPDCDAVRDELIDARFHQRQNRHGPPVKFTAPSRSRA